MDHITHEMRLANWRQIVEQCQARPRGQNAKEWLAANGINEKQYYYWQRRIREEVYCQMEGNLPAVGNNYTVSFAELPLQSLTGTGPHSFRPDAVIRTSKVTIELSNSVSGDPLLRLR